MIPELLCLLYEMRKQNLLTFQSSVLTTIPRAGFKGAGGGGGQPGRSPRGLHKIQVFLRRKASRWSSPETDHVIGNSLRVEEWGCRLQLGVERRRVCMYVFMYFLLS
jgi:hypothetical protein